MRVLVTGGTGFIGTNLCRELDERGHDVTAMARDPTNADLPESVATVAGDVTAAESIQGAFAEQDAVVNLVALSPLFKPKGGDEQHFQIHLRGTENVVEAAEEHDVDRILQMSGLGADPEGPTAFLRAKGRAETVVRESELDWTIVRPSVIFGEGGEFVSFTRKLAPPYLTPLPGGGRTQFQPIWIGDITPMLADCVEDEKHVGEIYELGGPEVLTLADVARTIHRTAGRSTNVVSVPMWLAKLGLSILDALPGSPMGTDQYRSLQLHNTTDDNDIDAFGVDQDDLTTLAVYLRT